MYLDCMKYIKALLFGLFFTSGAQASFANMTVYPTQGDLKTKFTLDASLSRNASGLSGPLQYQFKPSSNHSSSPLQSSPIFTFTPNKTGTFRAQVLVIDGRGIINTTYREYKVVEEIYRDVRIKVHNPKALYSEEVIMEAIVTTPPSEDRSKIQFRWDYQGDGIWDTNFSSSRWASYIYQAGVTSPVVEVKFGNGKIITRGSQKRKGYKAKITVQPSTIQAPILKQSPGGKTHLESTTFTFEASYRPIPNAWIEWSFDGESFHKGTDKITKKFDSPGTHEVRVRQCFRYSGPICAETTHEVELTSVETNAHFEIQVQNLRDQTTYQTNNNYNRSLIRATEGDRIQVSATRQNYGTYSSNTTQNYSYRWDFDGDGIWDTAFSKQPRAEYTYNHPGIFQILLEARPERFYNLKSFSTTQRNIRIDANHKPRIDLTTQDDALVAGERVLFQIHTADRESQASQLEIRFDLDGDGAWDTDFRRSPSSVYQMYDAPGEKTLTLQVRDPQKKVTTIQKKITVQKVPETNVKVKVSHKTQEVGKAFSFNANESTGARLQYSWKVLELPTTPSQKGSKAHFQFTTPGEYTICLRILDQWGQEQSINIPVVATPQKMATTQGASPRSGSYHLDPVSQPVSPYRITTNEPQKDLLDGFIQTGMRPGF